MVDAPHIFFRAVVHVAVSIIAAEITISVVAVTANNRTGLDIFVDNRLIGFVRVLDRRSCGPLVQRYQIP